MTSPEPDWNKVKQAKRLRQKIALGAFGGAVAILILAAIFKQSLQPLWLWKGLGKVCIYVGVIALISILWLPHPYDYLHRKKDNETPSAPKPES
jgi:hypothetical protein